MQGVATTRTSVPSSAGNLSSSDCAPAISQAMPSQTRTVSAGGGAIAPSASSRTTSKW